MWHTVAALTASRTQLNTICRLFTELYIKVMKRVLCGCRPPCLKQRCAGPHEQPLGLPVSITHTHSSTPLMYHSLPPLGPRLSPSSLPTRTPTSQTLTQLSPQLSRHSMLKGRLKQAQIMPHQLMVQRCSWKRCRATMTMVMLCLLVHQSRLTQSRRCSSHRYTHS